jgi:hypothetical protein
MAAGTTVTGTRMSGTGVAGTDGPLYAFRAVLCGASMTMPRVHPVFPAFPLACAIESTNAASFPISCHRGLTVRDDKRGL